MFTKFKDFVALVLCMSFVLIAIAKETRNEKSALVNKIAKESHSESEIESTQSTSHFNENYKLLSQSSADLEILNDSAEVIDDALNDDAIDGLAGIPIKKEGSRFDEFVLPDEFTKTHETSSKVPHSDEKYFVNVFKVPKSKTKKTLPQTQSTRSLGHSSIRNEPSVNDFNGEKLFALPDGNFSRYQNYFHAFTNLYDHNFWDANAFVGSISKDCLSDVKIYLNDLRESKDWAIKVADASGRYRGQFYFENDYWLGSKQFCYEVNDETRDKKEIPEMQFFVLKLIVYIQPIYNKLTPRVMSVGQCLPKVCTPQDVTTIMNRDSASIVLQKTSIANKNGNKAKANELNIFDVRIVPGEYSIWQDRKFYLFCFVIITLLILIVTASIYEYILESKGYIINEVDKAKKSESNSDKYEMNHMNNNNNSAKTDCEMKKAHQENDFLKLGFPLKVLLCFACGSNSRVILNAKNNSEDSLTCIHGLRLFTLLWTIMVHTYLQMFGIGENRFIRKISERKFIYQIVGNATFSVDTFFFISGLLVVLIFLKSEKSKRKKLDEISTMEGARIPPTNGFWCGSLRKSILFIFYRFVRLTPAYLAIIVFSELSVKVTYNQSVFTPDLTDHINCNKFWWRNIFYVNNFYPLSEMCLMWSWYLANDMQFYIITILLLILSIRYFKLSAITTILLLLSSWAITIYVSLQFKYVHKVAEPFESFDILYDKPWQRFGPYIMGMITGYILYRVKVPPKVPFAVNVLLWIISLSILVAIIFGVNHNGRLSVEMTSLYVSLGHTAWGFALIWIILSCSWGMAKPINSVLSYNGFYPLSRLTYCTYLIHPTIMILTSFQSDGPVHLRHGLVMTAFLGNSVISFVVAFIISLMVEAPVIRLLKLCLQK